LLFGSGLKSLAESWKQHSKVENPLLQGNLVLEQALQMVRHYFCCLSGGQLSAEEVAAFTSVFEVS
jgi:hypothetical protein